MWPLSLLHPPKLSCIGQENRRFQVIQNLKIMFPTPPFWQFHGALAENLASQYPILYSFMFLTKTAVWVHLQSFGQRVYPKAFVSSIFSLWISIIYPKYARSFVYQSKNGIAFTMICSWEKPTMRNMISRVKSPFWAVWISITLVLQTAGKMSWKSDGKKKSSSVSKLAISCWFQG